MALHGNHENLLDIYSRAKEQGPSIESVIQRLRQNQHLAREQDDQKRANINSAVKALWNTDQALKSYQLAQRGGYKGRFMEFLRHPELVGGYERKGLEMVASGREGKPGGILEVFKNRNAPAGNGIKISPANAMKRQIASKSRFGLAPKPMEAKLNKFPELAEPVEVAAQEASKSGGLSGVIGKASPTAGKVLAAADVIAGLKNMADEGANRENVAGTAVSALGLAAMFNPALAPFALAGSIGRYLKKVRG